MLIMTCLQIHVHSHSNYDLHTRYYEKYYSIFIGNSSDLYIFPSFKPYVQHQQPPSQDTQLRHHNDTEELVDGTLLGFGTMRNTYLESVAMKLFVAEFVGIAWNSLLAWKIKPCKT